MIALVTSPAPSRRPSSKKHPATTLHLLTCATCRDREVVRQLASADSASLGAAEFAIEAGGGPEVDGEVRRLVEMLEQTPPETLRGDRKQQRFFRREVLDHLLALGDLALRADPERAERLGLLAVVLAGHLDAGSSWVPPGLVGAFLLIAGARRLRRNFSGAEDALRRAAPFLAEGVEEATYARTLALLRWEQGRLCEAAALLGEAADGFAAEDQPVEEPACLALRGLLDAEQGRWERALPALLRARAALDGHKLPALALCSGLALAEVRAELGEQESAQGTLESLRPSVQGDAVGLEQEPAWMAFTWTEARISARAGSYEKAERLLLPLHARLTANGRHAEAALVCLDLALVAVMGGNPNAAPGLADALADAFAGRAELAFALQALYEIDEAAPRPPAEAWKAAARSVRCLRTAFRAVGVPVGTIPYP